MKKYIAILAIAASVLSGQAASTTINVISGTFTNLLSVVGGSARVTQIIITPTVASSNSIVSLYDTPTNALTYVTPAYTNTVSYNTNTIVAWTNYFGAVNSWTNISQVDLTNNLVLSTTNSYPVRLTGGAAYGSSTTFSGSYYFGNGIWATNSGQGPASVTIVYQQ